jgi:hypothetical protein
MAHSRSVTPVDSALLYLPEHRDRGVVPAFGCRRPARLRLPADRISCPFNSPTFTHGRNRYRHSRRPPQAAQQPSSSWRPAAGSIGHQANSPVPISSQGRAGEPCRYLRRHRGVAPRDDRHRRPALDAAAGRGDGVHARRGDFSATVTFLQFGAAAASTGCLLGCTSAWRYFFRNR